MHYTRFRQVWDVAKSLVVQYFFESLLYVLDTLFVAGLGADALDAVATALYLCYLIQFPINACLLSSFTTYVSQAWGAKDVDSIRSMFSKALTTAVSAGVISCAVSLAIARPVIMLVYPNEASLNIALTYFKLIVPAFPGSSLFITYLAFLYGIGRTREATLCWVMSDIVNIVLDPLLIYGLKLGVVGAALAFDASIYSVLPLLHMLLKRNIGVELGFSLPTSDVFTLIRRVGLAVSVERVVISILYTVYAAIVGRYGSNIYTAYQLGLRIESFIYMPILAFRDAANILIGQYVGAERIDELPEILKSCQVLALLTIGVATLFSLSIAYLVFKFLLAGMYVKLWNLIVTYLVLAVASDVGLALTFTCIGAYQAIGKTFVSTLIDLTSMSLLRVLPSFLLYLCNAPIELIWLTMSIDTIFRGTCLTLLFNKKLYREPAKFARPYTSAVSS